MKIVLKGITVEYGIRPTKRKFPVRLVINPTFNGKNYNSFFEFKDLYFKTVEDRELYCEYLREQGQYLMNLK